LDLTDADAAAWWNSKTPQQRYDGMGYSGWAEDVIAAAKSPFVGPWESLPNDVRRDILLGMINRVFGQ
jgi:hypothetical protein